MSLAHPRTLRPLREVVGDLLPVPASVEITELALDSRHVNPGAAFLACRGTRTHGLEFAAGAVARGARAVLYEPDADHAVPEFGSGVFVAPVANLSAEISAMADRFYERPSLALTIAAITGTNGKTTCSWLLALALAALGRRTAYLGTLGSGFPPQLVASELTTPDAVTVQRELRRLREAGAECVAMEVSSHALDQRRVEAVRLRTAALTNLSRDHLDYHGTMEAYAAAKARLFDWGGLESCVLNADDEFGARLAGTRRADLRLVLTSRRPQPPALAPARAEWVRAARVASGARGLEIGVESSFGSASLATRLVGEFNVENVLTSLAILLCWDVPIGAACRALEDCPAPPGRMEAFGGGESAPLAIVDFAHSPDALAKALRAARAHCRGTLWVVFGCGGDRDRGKRPLMAAAAAALADRIVITDDNPRGEDPAAIVADIVAGLPPAQRPRIEHDRAAAIRDTLADAAAGDVVLVAGKGHEEYQIHGPQRRPFSDRALVRAALGEVRA